MDVKLTKDADRMICEIYATYLERRSSGEPKSVAVDFSDESLWPDQHRPDWLCDDGRACIVELRNAGLISCLLYGGFMLKPQGIIYMESRFPNGLSQVLDFLGKIKALLPL